MTELSFLLDLLMNHKLQKATKDLIAARIKEVELRYTARAAPSPAQYQSAGSTQLPFASLQTPSTLAAMARNGFQETTVPVEAIAQTPAAAAALASRKQAIQIAMSDVPEKGRTSPRKF